MATTGTKLSECAKMFISFFPPPLQTTKQYHIRVGEASN